MQISTAVRTGAVCVWMHVGGEGVTTRRDNSTDAYLSHANCRARPEEKRALN